MDKAILVALEDGLSNIDYSLDELANLAKSLSIETILRLTQKRIFPHPTTYVGKGKLEEIKQAITALEVDLVIFNDELTPTQIRVLEKALDVQIIDRSFLILSIFSKRAKTKGSYLEVSLAQQKYLLPRLVGMRDSLSRQGGGTYNAKGPGETKLELDRRTILKTIKQLEDNLKKWEKENQLSRKQRVENRVPIVSLVGYTNAGKSATLNSLLKFIDSDKNVFEKDILFATLSTSSRQIKKRGYPGFILTDTIGFVSKLPHAFVNSFKATLGEVVNSNLIIHLIDGANKEKEFQKKTTINVLRDLDVENIPTLEIYSKLDLLEENPDNEDLWISNYTGFNIEKLLHLIYENLFGSPLIVTLKVPFTNAQITPLINEDTRILKTTFLESGTVYEVIMFNKQLPLFKDYLKSSRYL